MFKNLREHVEKAKFALGLFLLHSILIFFVVRTVTDRKFLKVLEDLK